MSQKPTKVFVIFQEMADILINNTMDQEMSQDISGLRCTSLCETIYNKYVHYKVITALIDDDRHCVFKEHKSKRKI